MLPGHLLLGNMNSCCKVQLLWLGVTIQHLHQVVILLCPRHKLLQSQLTILVNIHSFKYGFSGVKRRGISPSQASLNIKYFMTTTKLSLLHIKAAIKHQISLNFFYHFVDSGDYLQHFFSCDESISVQIIDGEGPLQFLLNISTRSNTQSTKKLSEVNGSVTISILISSIIYYHSLLKFFKPKVLKTCSANFEASP